MTALSKIFEELGIGHYLDTFLEQGFDSWDTILDITESDFDALGVKLGHRRKLQRRIANTRGLPLGRALASPTSTTPGDINGDEQPKVGEVRDIKEGGSGPHGAKRKYRRHPKTDENAPERPPSAYVIFSNKMREDLKGRNLSFTEIAKLVGEHWQNLSPGEKEPYEQSAYTAKERYNNELAEYKKTQSFKDYSQYLADFKHKQNQQLATEMGVVKRPKLEATASTASSGTGSSASSQAGGNSTGAEYPLGRMRVNSPASSTSQWHASTPPSSIAMTPMSLPALTNVPKGPGLQGRLHPGSPVDMPKVLPGYRESILGPGGSPVDMPNVLLGYRESILVPGAQHWREGHRDEGSTAQQTSRGSIERRVSQSGSTSTITQDHLNLNDLTQHRRTPQGSLNPPPSLTSESTVQSNYSVTSNSSMYFAPRTPLEPDFNRALPIPSLFPQRSGSYDGQLPFFSGPSSLSPQASLPGTQQSPNGSWQFIPYLNSIKDFPTTMPLMQRYSEAPQGISNSMRSAIGRPDMRRSEKRTDPSHPQLMSNLHHQPTSNHISTADELDLDPINALLRAGEIVNRNSREGKS
ncbi:hypothetical protein DSL72_007983 [Monilinia vaccinii-corymbosi]|uniref:HMG box domain-containing protein n=1 Tax=Monilinia vaccinii-corymbosi TaxID=61207 RepID=A0A8A3PIM4_9HELO|nr:hypothetical protein DSL72_007983 [Monilinia vaccinii-corymbosi]